MSLCFMVNSFAFAFNNLCFADNSNVPALMMMSGCSPLCNNINFNTFMTKFHLFFAFKLPGD